MRIKTFLGCLLLIGCVKHLETHVGPSTKPIISPDHTWAYYVEGPSDWTVISKVGTQKALRELCPHGYTCTVEEIGVMYRIRRAQ